MTNGTRHDPCIPRHWAMGCPAWTLAKTSHNRVVNKIRPNTDVASISSVLHLVWPLAQSLSSMVVPTRSHNSSWHSLWDLRGTQAPQLRQSNNTLRGFWQISILQNPTLYQIHPIPPSIMGSCVMHLSELSSETEDPLYIWCVLYFVFHVCYFTLCFFTSFSSNWHGNGQHVGPDAVVGMFQYTTMTSLWDGGLNLTSTSTSHRRNLVPCRGLCLCKSCGKQVILGDLN